MPDWATLEAQIRDLHTQHKTDTEIAKTVGVSRQSLVDQLRRWGLKPPRQPSKPAKGDRMSDETPVEVLPGQTSLDATDTPDEVHYSAVGEFDALPEGYAKTIQPMREYTEAEEWALNESMRLYGFIGAIVRDQYGRILDGNQRHRIARLRGLGVPYTITPVRDDAHASEIATSLNAVRRHYTPEQRQALVPILRDQGFTYEAIAEALGVGKATVYRDVMGVLRVRTEQIVPHETISAANREPSPPVARVKRKGGGTYPAQRPTGTAQRPTTSPADRQVAQVINILMTHAKQWDEKHWQAFLEVVQTLRGNGEAPAPA